MKRKLRINRETLRNLADQETQEAAGGFTTVISLCGTCVTCNLSCGGTCNVLCTAVYSACILCR